MMDIREYCTGFDIVCVFLRELYDIYFFVGKEFRLVELG